MNSPSRLPHFGQGPSSVLWLIIHRRSSHPSIARARNAVAAIARWQFTGAVPGIHRMRFAYPAAVVAASASLSWGISLAHGRRLLLARPLDPADFRLIGGRPFCCVLVGHVPKEA